MPAAHHAGLILPFTPDTRAGNVQFDTERDRLQTEATPVRTGEEQFRRVRCLAERDGGKPS